MGAVTMSELGWVLYVLALALSIWLYRRVVGRSLENLVEAGRREHEAVQRVLQLHPRGGRAAQIKRWLKQAGG
jgi:hypothetical protein